MVEKGSDHSSDKSPSTPEQVVQRTYSVQSARSGGKNSKVSTREIRLFIFSMHHLESDQMEIQYGLKHGALSLAYFKKNKKTDKTEDPALSIAQPFLSCVSFPPKTLRTAEREAPVHLDNTLRHTELLHSGTPGVNITDKDKGETGRIRPKWNT